MPEKDLQGATEVLKEVVDELGRIVEHHGLFNSAHEAYGVLAEEVDEFWDEVKMKRSERDLAKLGGISLALVAIAFVLSLAFMTWLGRAFSLGPKLTTLLAVGSSVCGVSAIIATQGAIEADEQDTSTAIAAILALGAISLFAFPAIGHALHMSDHAYGIWGRPRRRQHGRSQRRRSSLLGHRRQIRSSCQDLPQRAHRIRRSRLRHRLGTQRPGQRRESGAA